MTSVESFTTIVKAVYLVFNGATSKDYECVHIIKSSVCNNIIPSKLTIVSNLL